MFITLSALICLKTNSYNNKNKKNFQYDMVFWKLQVIKKNSNMVNFVTRTTFVILNIINYIDWITFKLTVTINFPFVYYTSIKLNIRM